MPGWIPKVTCRWAKKSGGQPLRTRDIDQPDEENNHHERGEQYQLCPGAHHCRVEPLCLRDGTVKIVIVNHTLRWRGG